MLKTAIQNKKHIVTANKELLAKHGEELFKLASENNVVIMYEAAVGGGIPIIMPVKMTLSANRIDKIAAILNGTTNYILTKMDEEGADYSEVLAEAQKLGYAETDPTGDVEGFDAAYKIATLATIAFKKRVKIQNIHREGITKISAKDMAYAKQLGYKIKLIALAKMNNNEADVRVHPMLVKSNHTLAHINGVTNGIANRYYSCLLKGETIKWYAIGSTQLPNNGGERTITPSTTDQVLPDGYYSGNITVKGDSDLKPENIVEGVEIFGVTGSANISNLGGARYASDTTPTYDYNRTMYTDISIDFTPKSIVVVGGDWYVVVAPNIIPTTKCIMLYRSNGNMTYNNITYEYEVSGNIYKVPAPGGLGYVTWYAWG